MQTSSVQLQQPPTDAGYMASTFASVIGKYMKTAVAGAAVHQHQEQTASADDDSDDSSVASACVTAVHVTCIIPDEHQDCNYKDS